MNMLPLFVFGTLVEGDVDGKLAVALLIKRFINAGCVPPLHWCSAS